MDVTADQAHPIEVTFDPGLPFVFAKIADVTAGFPGALAATVQMVETFPGTYGCFFTPQSSKDYLVQKAVYSDDTAAVLDPDFTPGSDAWHAVSGSSGTVVAGGSNVVGVIENSPEMIGAIGDIGEVNGEIENQSEVLGLIDTPTEVVGVLEDE